MRYHNQNQNKICLPKIFSLKIPPYTFPMWWNQQWFIITCDSIKCLSATFSLVKNPHFQMKRKQVWKAGKTEKVNHFEIVWRPLWCFKIELFFCFGKKRTVIWIVFLSGFMKTASQFFLGHTWYCINNPLFRLH